MGLPKGNSPVDCSLSCPDFMVGKRISSSAELDQGFHPWIPQPFEKGWRKLLTTLTESFCSSAIDIAVYGESVVGGGGTDDMGYLHGAYPHCGARLPG